MNTIPESYQPERLEGLDVHEVFPNIDPRDRNFAADLRDLNGWAKYFRDKNIPFRIEQDKKGKWGMVAERKGKSDTYQRKPKMQ